jgi:uncharacterized membrane protein
LVYALLKLAHVLAVVLWVGGMAFAHFFLRPAVQALEPPQRLALMQRVLQRFLAAAGWAVLAALASGAGLYAMAAAGLVVPWGWHAMAALGAVMAFIYAAVRFVFYPRLWRAVAAQDWKTGGAAMADIRRWVGINLALGVLTIVVAIAGRA